MHTQRISIEESQGLLHSTSNTSKKSKKRRNEDKNIVDVDSISTNKKQIVKATPTTAAVVIKANEVTLFQQLLPKREEITVYNDDYLLSQYDKLMAMTEHFGRLCTESRDHKTAYLKMKEALQTKLIEIENNCQFMNEQNHQMTEIFNSQFMSSRNSFMMYLTQCQIHFKQGLVGVASNPKATQIEDSNNNSQSSFFINTPPLPTVEQTSYDDPSFLDNFLTNNPLTSVVTSDFLLEKEIKEIFLPLFPLSTPLIIEHPYPIQLRVFGPYCEIVKAGHLNEGMCFSSIQAALERIQTELQFPSLNLNDFQCVFAPETAQSYLTEKRYGYSYVTEEIYAQVKEVARKYNFSIPSLFYSLSEEAETALKVRCLMS